MVAGVVRVGEMYYAAGDEAAPVVVLCHGVMPEPEDVPTVLGEWLSRLHAEMTAYPGRIEVRGILSFDTLLSGVIEEPRHPSHQGRGLR